MDKSEQKIPVTFKAYKSDKEDAAKTFDALGLNITTAMNIFLKKSIEVGGLPFEVRNSSLSRDNYDSEAEIIRRSKDAKNGIGISRHDLIE